jgi:hypothetical protein
MKRFLSFSNKPMVLLPLWCWNSIESICSLWAFIAIFFAQFVFVGKPKTATRWSSREATESKHRLDLQAWVEEGKETGTLASCTRTRRVPILSLDHILPDVQNTRLLRHSSLWCAELYVYSLMCRVIFYRKKFPFFGVMTRMALVCFTYMIVLTPMLRPMFVNHKTWGNCELSNKRAFKRIE